MPAFNDIWPERIDNSNKLYPPSLDRGEQTVPGKVAIVVVTWNTQRLTQRCLRKIITNTNPNEAALVLVENGSTERGAKSTIIKEFECFRGERVLIDQEKNTYFSQAFNAGIRQVPEDTDAVILMSSDCEPKSPRWLKYFTDAIAHSDAAGLLVQSSVTEEYAEIWRDREIKYNDDQLEDRMYQMAGNVGSGFTHLTQDCCIIRMKALLRIGLYLQHGRFYQSNSNWELSMRMNAAGLQLQHVVPDVHHWESISRLWATQRRKYNQLCRNIEDPHKLGEYMVKGRPAW